MARAIAYYHGAPRIVEIANAFADGCRRHSVPCSVKSIADFVSPVNADIVWVYGLGPAKGVFDAYAGLARRLVGDLGYWQDLMPPMTRRKRYVRVSVDAQQPDKHLQLRKHPHDRFESMPALVRAVRPVESRGEHILLCGMSQMQARRYGFEYGEWETATLERLRQITDREIIVRAKPKNAPIAGGEPTLSTPAHAIRSAWAVVCYTGNIGADCILHGVPVFSTAGPGSVYHKAPIETIDDAVPLSDDERMDALADISYWHWNRNEMASGRLWENIRLEGFV